MTPQEQDFTDRSMQLFERLLGERDEWKRLMAERSLNGFDTSITTGNLALIPAFAHLTQQELNDAYAAILALDTALGDNVSGNATHLIKASR